MELTNHIEINQLSGFNCRTIIKLLLSCQLKRFSPLVQGEEVDVFYRHSEGRCYSLRAITRLEAIFLVELKRIVLRSHYKVSHTCGGLNGIAAR